jgi:MFS family permease
VQGASVLTAGLRTLPISMGAFIMAPIAGTIAGRIGTRLPMTLGLLLCGGAIFLLTRVLEPTTSYASLWWILALMGLGLGLTLSPATASVFTATPSNRTGLGSSMFTTSNEIGNTLGIAVIGALVLQQFNGNIVTQLTQRGISAATSTQVAQTVAAAGAQANHTSLPVQLPLAASSLQQAFNQAFVDALHSSFLVSSLLLIAAALLVGLAFKQDQVVVPTEQAEETPGPLGTPVVAAVEVQER